MIRLQNEIIVVPGAWGDFFLETGRLSEKRLVQCRATHKATPSYPQNNKYSELCRSIIVSAPHFDQHSNLTQSCRIKKSKPQGCEFFIN